MIRFDIENAVCTVEEDSEMEDIDAIIQTIVSLQMALRFGVFKIITPPGWVDRARPQTTRLPCLLNVMYAINSPIFLAPFSF